MTRKLEGFKVAILATNGFEQVELTSPKTALEEAGAKVLVIAPETGMIQGFHHTDKGEQVVVDLTLDHAVAGDFDAVLLPGGVVNADALRIVDKAQHFVMAMERAGKPLAVICHGSWLLISAGLVHGKTLTSWRTLRDDIRNAGGEWVDREVVTDGNWVSSRKPEDLPAFNRELIDLFWKSRELASTSR